MPAALAPSIDRSTVRGCRTVTPFPRRAPVVDEVRETGCSFSRVELSSW